MIRIGNNIIYSVAYSQNAISSNTPTWLSPGSYSVVISAMQASNSGFKGALSIVEFNIVL